MNTLDRPADSAAALPPTDPRPARLRRARRAIAFLLVVAAGSASVTGLYRARQHDASASATPTASAALPASQP